MHEITTRLPQLDYLYAASFGQVPGARVVQVQGMNPDIDTGTVPEAIVPFGGLFPWQTTAVALEAVSTSVDDSAAGLGLRTMVVSGLGLALNEITEVVTLNGLTPVPLVNSYYRVNNVIGLTVGAGASASNIGDVVVRTVVGATPQAFIPIGYGRDQCCRYTVPAGYNMSIIDGFASLLDVTNSSAFSVALQLYGREQNAPFLSRFFFTLSTMTPTYNIKPPILRPLPPGSDVTLRATNSSVNNVLMTATLNLLLTPL